MTPAGREERTPGARPVISRAAGAVLAGLFVAATCGGTVACGRAGGDAAAGDTDGAPAEEVPAPALGPAPVLEPGPAGSPPPAAAGGNPVAGSSAQSDSGRRLRSDDRPRGTPADHERYRRLRVETLRLMIEAARRALPIGPFQQRIDAAVGTALQDVSEAADRMEEIVADLRQAIAAADRC